MSKLGKCQCTDPGCDCVGQCHSAAVEILFRVDMEDWTGTAICEACAADAYECGCFADEPAS